MGLEKIEEEQLTDKGLVCTAALKLRTFNQETSIQNQFVLLIYFDGYVTKLR